MDTTEKNNQITFIATAVEDISCAPPLKDLQCLMCHKTPEHEEIFISKCDDEEHIEASMCMRCAEHSEDTRPEMYGGWLVIKRVFNKFYARDVNGNFQNEITYY